MSRSDRNATVAEKPIALVVEGDLALRKAAADLIEEADVESAEASTAEEALAILQAQAADVRLIFTDFHLAGRLDGIDLARVASVRWPWIRVLVSSGNAPITDLPRNVALLPKPWAPADLRAQLRWEAARARAAV
jgi:CheY-like chemotaxis protein